MIYMVNMVTTIDKVNTIYMVNAIKMVIGQHDQCGQHIIMVNVVTSIMVGITLEKLALRSLT